MNALSTRRQVTTTCICYDVVHLGAAQSVARPQRLSHQGEEPYPGRSAKQPQNLWELQNAIFPAGSIFSIIVLRLEWGHRTDGNLSVRCACFHYFVPVTSAVVW